MIKGVNDYFVLTIVIIFTIVLILFTIGYFFESHYSYFLGIMVLTLLLLCFWHDINKEIRFEKYYKFHIGYISCDEYYNRHLYHTGWHIYGEAGMTEEELMKYREENKDKMIIDGIYKF